jgi:DNA-binding transcriptional ArsR family regulator
MARRKEFLTLRDPRALRALAHPARQQLVQELFAGRVLTATEAAEIVGLTPSAVSHHLRALEKWGIARRAKATGDGRERPWEGTARRLNLRPSAGVGAQAAMHSVLGTILDDFNREVIDFVDNSEDEPWKRTYQGLSRGELWLTRDEAQQVSQEITALLEPLEKGRSSARHPRGARRTSVTWSIVPTEPPPANDSARTLGSTARTARRPGE